MAYLAAFLVGTDLVRACEKCRVTDVSQTGRNGIHVGGLWRNLLHSSAVVREYLVALDEGFGDGDSPCCGQGLSLLVGCVVDGCQSRTESRLVASIWSSSAQSPAYQGWVRPSSWMRRAPAFAAHDRNMRLAP